MNQRVKDLERLFVQEIEERSKMSKKPDDLKSEKDSKKDVFELGDSIFAEQDSSLSEEKKYKTNKVKSTVQRKFSELRVQ